MRSRAAGIMIGWAALTVGIAVVARGAVALPEHCGDATPSTVDSAIGSTVSWFEENQRGDGTWLYRFDARTGTDLGGYSWVRHAGVLLSLYQAARANEPAALTLADDGRTVAIDRQVVRGDGWAALNDGGSLTAGGTALLVVALGERRDATGDTKDDELLRDLGRHLSRQIESSGAVLELAYLDGAAVPGSLSPFTTGEAFFALARLHRLFPGEGWDEPASRIARYVITERADAEGFVPDMSDHWSAYGFAEVRRWPERGTTGLDADELGFARRQIGLMSIQTRYETQRTNDGLSRWVRGRQALGAAIGTIGEAMGQWWEVGAVEPALDGRRGALADRLSCMAGAIIDRQVDAEEAAAYPVPDATRGAHLQFGITQMDDQQHTLSALLMARSVLADPTPLPRRSPIPTNVWLLALATIAALNPLRLAAGATGAKARRVRAVGLAGGITVGVMAVLAAIGGPLLRALDVSAGNGLLAAAVVVVCCGIYGLITTSSVRPGGLLTPLVIPLGLRPELMLLAVACGAGGRGWAFVAIMTAATVAAVASVSLPDPSPIIHTWLTRLIGALAVATALGLVIDGVYAI